ncbi:MAG: hypothetical protein QXR84_09970 [Candidatus Bathyarchaeia archaeon]
MIHVQKGFALQAVLTLTLLTTLLLSSHFAAGQPQRMQVRINQSETDRISLTNATLPVEVIINLTDVTIRNQEDDIKLIVSVPKILENKIAIKDFSLTQKDDKIIFEKIVSNVNITEQKIFQDEFLINFTNIDCEIISEISSAKYNVTIRVELVRNEEPINETNIRLEIEPERSWQVCFQKFLNLEDAICRWVNGNLNLSLTISFSTRSRPLDNLSLNVTKYSIEGCIPQPLCVVEEGRAVINVNNISNNKFNLTIIFSRNDSLKIIKDEKLMVLIKLYQKEISKSLEPEISIEKLSFDKSILILHLRNNGSLPFNNSERILFDRENIQITELEWEEIVNPNRSMELKYNITVKSSKNLENILKIEYNLSKNKYREIVFNINLSRLKAHFIQSNELEITIRIDTSNSSLHLNILKEYPLNVSIKGLSILNCSSSELLCEGRNDYAIAYGNITLPKDITLRLSVKDNGGPENRNVTIILSEKLQSHTTVKVYEQRHDMLPFLSLAIVIVVVVLVSVVLLSRKRVSRAPAEVYVEEVEEPFFDLG